MSTFEIIGAPSRWIVVAAAVGGTAAGLWWALADFVLDRFGPPPSEWGQQPR